MYKSTKHGTVKIGKSRTLLEEDLKTIRETFEEFSSLPCLFKKDGIWREPEPLEENMSRIFVQKIGNGKGKEVEVIKKGSSSVVLKSVETNFIFTVAVRDFFIHYEEKTDAGDRNNVG